MKTVPLALTMLATGALAAGCGASSGGSGHSSVSSPARSASATSAAAAGGSTAGASPAAGPSGSVGSSSTGVTACKSAHLRASLGGGTGAGASNNHIGFNLRNVGSVSCTLYGYPGVSWVAGPDGHQVGEAATPVAESSGSPEKTITLVPGAVASAPLDIVQAAVYSRSQCHPVPVRGLRVYPPGEKAALFLSLPTGSGGYGECSATTNASTLNVGWVQPGTQPGGGDQG